MTKETIGHVMTGIMCVCALAVTGLLIRQQFFMSSAAGAAMVPTTIRNWKNFQSGRALGLANKRVSLVVFSDYECPACRAFSKVVDSLRAKHPDLLSVYYRNLPIPSHKYARAAAFAAECAAVQGRFNEAHRLLFNDPDSIGTRSWSSFALQVGVKDSASFNTCVRDSTQFAVVQKDEADARRLGIKVTPTLLLDDQLIDGGRTLEQMEEFVQRRLKK